MDALRKKLVQTLDIEHKCIYGSACKPGHNSWISLWKSMDDRLFISFQEMEGDRTRSPSYDFMDSAKRSNYDIRQRFFSSCDQGESWTFESDKELFLPNLMFTAIKNPLPSGKILSAYASRNLKEFHEVKGAIIITSSMDGGRTWSFETSIKHPDYKSLNPTSIIYDKTAGVILSAYTDSGDCLCFISGDEGKSWDKNFTIAKASGNLSFWEPTVTKISDGTFMCIIRTHREDIPKHNGINYHKVIFTLRPEGFNPSLPEDTGIGFRGKPDIIKTSSGILILAAPGHLFAFSCDEGNTWELHLDMLKGLSHNADPALIEMEPDLILCGYFFGSDYPFPPPADEYIGCTKFEIKY